MSPRRLLASLAVVSALARPAVAAPRTQVVRFEVVTLGTVPELRLSATARWLGQDLTVELRDDGRLPDSLAGDHHYTGELSGEPVRALPVRISGIANGLGQFTAYDSIELVAADGDELAWSLDLGDPPNARRVALARLTRGVMASEMTWVAATLGWANFALIYVAWLGQQWLRGQGAMTRPWVAPLLYFVLAVSWTWPAAIAGPSLLAVRHFDGIGTVWMFEAGARLFPAMIDPLTGWPAGAEYHRPEEWLVVLASPLLSLLNGPVAYNWFQIVGLTVSATAAEAFARRLGARAPWSWISGVAFAFNGIAATALLEGHVYHVMDPWLPLFGAAWLDATGPDGRPRHGLLAGLWFVLTALSTAYLGIAAAVVAVGFAVPAVAAPDRLRRLRAMLPALLLVVPFAAWYLHGYALGTLNTGLVTDRSAAEVESAVQTGSASLVTLAGPTPELDRVGHSVAATLSATVLALCLVSPWILGRSVPRWRGVLATGAVALVLSLGPRLAFDAHHPTAPLPMSLLLELPGAGYLRFPLRLGWVWVLCGGAVASCVAQALATRVRATSAVLVMVVVEAFLIVRLPFRQSTQVGPVPSVYAEATGPVLDLYPVSDAEGDDLNSFTKAWACYYQTVHGRPIADHCLETSWARNPRSAVVDPLVPLLFAQDIAAAHALLTDKGFTTVAFHPDLYTAADRTALALALAGIDPAPKRSTNGGELVVAYSVGRAP